MTLLCLVLLAAPVEADAVDPMATATALARRIEAPDARAMALLKVADALRGEAPERARALLDEAAGLARPSGAAAGVAVAYATAGFVEPARAVLAKVEAPPTVKDAVRQAVARAQLAKGDEAGAVKTLSQIESEEARRALRLTLAQRRIARGEPEAALAMAAGDDAESGRLLEALAAEAPRLADQGIKLRLLDGLAAAAAKRKAPESRWPLLDLVAGAFVAAGYPDRALVVIGQIRDEAARAAALTRILPALAATAFPDEDTPRWRALVRLVESQKDADPRAALTGAVANAFRAAGKRSLAHQMLPQRTAAPESQGAPPVTGEAAAESPPSPFGEGEHAGRLLEIDRLQRLGRLAAARKELAALEPKLGSADEDADAWASVAVLYGAIGDARRAIAAARNLPGTEYESQIETLETVALQAIDDGRFEDVMPVVAAITRIEAPPEREDSDLAGSDDSVRDCAELEEDPIVDPRAGALTAMLDALDGRHQLTLMGKVARVTPDRATRSELLRTAAVAHLDRGLYRDALDLARAAVNHVPAEACADLVAPSLARDEALAEVAASAADVGQLDVARLALAEISDEEDRPEKYDRLVALAPAFVKGRAHGPIIKLALGLKEAYGRDRALLALVLALAAEARFDEAIALVPKIGDASARVEALVQVARVMRPAGQPVSDAVRATLRELVGAP